MSINIVPENIHIGSMETNTLQETPIDIYVNAPADTYQLMFSDVVRGTFIATDVTTLACR